jgi:hypothetical protein
MAHGSRHLVPQLARERREMMWDKRDVGSDAAGGADREPAAVGGLRYRRVQLVRRRLPAATSIIRAAQLLSDQQRLSRIYQNNNLQ